MKTIIPSERDMVYLKAEVINLGYQIQHDSGGCNPDPDDTVRAWVEMKRDDGEDYQLTDDQIATLANAIELEFPPQHPDENGYDKFLDREDWEILGRQARKNGW